MTEPSGKGRIETGTVLAVAALALTILNLVINNKAATDETLSDLRERVCAIESVLKRGECR